jgi:hypothetical protein
MAQPVNIDLMPFCRAAQNQLGPPGRLISYSKTSYLEDYPKHVVVFNANLCVGSHKVWFGDLDLNLDGDKLQRIANQLGKSVHVLYESDGRFQHETEPHIEKTVATYIPVTLQKEDE